MTSLELQRPLPASPERVWRAFTTEELGSWLWPAAWRVECIVEAHPGGRWRVAAEQPAMAVSGVMRELQPPSRLVLTWRWDGDEHESLVTITLTAAEGGTLLRIRHEQLVDDADRDAHAQGWNDCLERLPAHLRSA